MKINIIRNLVLALVMMTNFAMANQLFEYRIEDPNSSIELVRAFEPDVASAENLAYELSIAYNSRVSFVAVEPSTGRDSSSQQ